MKLVTEKHYTRDQWTRLTLSNRDSLACKFSAPRIFCQYDFNIERMSIYDFEVVICANTRLSIKREHVGNTLFQCFQWSSPKWYPECNWSMRGREEERTEIVYSNNTRTCLCLLRRLFVIWISKQNRISKFVLIVIIVVIVFLWIA